MDTLLPDSRTDTRRPARPAGFTLIELMLALAVVAILTIIAVPMYTSQIQKARRTDAKSALLDLAAREERYFATNNTYTATAASLGYSSAFPVSLSTWNTLSYTLSVTVPTGGATFTAVATRSAAQATDPCGDFQLTDQGTQSTLNTSNPPVNCW